MKNRAVFLDRDGVLNEVEIRNGGVEPPRFPEDLRIVTEAPEALGRLKRAGFLLIVVTNQPDVARGRIARTDAEAINSALLNALPIDEVLACFHDDSDACPCRKPAPGMIIAAAAKWSVDVTMSWLIGDRWVDIAAGRRAGVDSILLERDWSWHPSSAGLPPAELRSCTRRATLGACVGVVLNDVAGHE